MKMRSILAGVAALAVSAISIAAIPASAAATVYPDSITVMVAGGWGAYSGTWTEANADNSITITDNGTYTITVPSGEAGELGDGQWAMAIRTTDFVASNYGDDGDDFYACLEKGGVNLTVDSVKIGDKEIKTSDSVVRDDDDGNNMRVNIYNQWTSPKVAIVDGNQVFDADVSVTFTVSGLKFGEQTTEEETTAAPEETTTAAGETTTAAAGATTTTTKAGDSKTTTAATTKAASGGASTTAAATTTNTATGDNGIAVALAALTIAGGVALVSRKSK
jgi:hypothetical protein